MTLEEKKESCSKALITWMMTEKDANFDMSKHDEDIENLFTSKMILKKFKVFGIDIVLPDMLLLILAICVDSNPGQFQIVLKDLLNHIKSRKGPIPAGYIITSDDFVDCFMMNFPIMEIQNINDKYHKLWDDQKYLNMGSSHRENACDIPEWWEEVMK